MNAWTEYHKAAQHITRYTYAWPDFESALLAGTKERVQPPAAAQAQNVTPA
jgi:hypothetical protein